MNNDSNNSINNNNVTPQTNETTPNVVNEPPVVNQTPVSEPVTTPASETPVVTPAPANEPVASQEVNINNSTVTTDSSLTPNTDVNPVTGGTLNIGGTTPTNNGGTDTTVNTEKKSFNVKLLIYIAIIVVLVVVLVLLLLGKNKKTTAKTELLEGVTVSGSICANSKCTVTLGNDATSYVFEAGDADFFLALSNYQEYVKINVYYKKSGKENVITRYSLFLKSTDEDITSIVTESDLRAKIGLYEIGTQTDTFTLKEIGLQGVGISDDVTYSYANYVFTNSRNSEYTMKYDESEGKLELVEGKQYKVTFKVTKGTFDYEYSIVKVEEV